MSSEAEVQVADHAPSVEMLETVNCPFCKSSDAAPLTGPICDGPMHHFQEPYRSLATTMSRCTQCNLVYQRERLTGEHLARLYDEDNYHCYKSFSERGMIIRELAKLSARLLIKEVERHRPDEKRFVDFGCGNGSWLELFRACGVDWELYGTEIGEGNVQHIEKLGFKGFCCDETTIDQCFKPGTVGMIYMHHVIEHVPNPLETLQNLSRVLVPGGIIFGQTPNWKCWEQFIFGDQWCQWHQPHHLTIFDNATMAAHAREAGLEVVSLKSSLSGATQWSTSLLKYWAAKRGRLYRWTGEPLHPYLTLSFLPISVVQSIIHNTSHMDFILRKPS